MLGGAWRSLAWKHNDAEDVYAAQFAAGDDMPMMSARGIEPRPNRVNQPAGWGRGEGGDGGS